MKLKTLAYSPFGRGTNTSPFNEVFKSQFNPVEKGTLEGADAFLLWGGEDIHPSFYKQPCHIKNDNRNTTPSYRDLVEWELMREAYARSIPCLLYTSDAADE